MTTIYVRKLYADQGKYGMEYKILATDGLYYTSKHQFPANVEEGIKLELKTSPTKNPKYLKIEEIVSINTNPNQVILPPKGQAVGRENAAVKPSPSIPDLTPQLQAIWIANAYEALKEAKLDPDVEHDLLVLLVKQYGEDRMNKVIDAQQNKRYGR